MSKFTPIILLLLLSGCQHWQPVYYCPVSEFEGVLQRELTTEEKMNCLLNYYDERGITFQNWPDSDKELLQKLSAAM